MSSRPAKSVLNEAVSFVPQVFYASPHRKAHGLQKDQLLIAQAFEQCLPEYRNADKNFICTICQDCHICLKVIERICKQEC
jgi:hypothetical protein